MKECLNDLNAKNTSCLLTKNKTHNIIRKPNKTYTTTINMQMNFGKKNIGLKQNLNRYNTQKNNLNSIFNNNNNYITSKKANPKIQQTNKAPKHEYIFNLAMENLNRYQEDIITNKENILNEQNNKNVNKNYYLKKNKSSKIFKDFNNIPNNDSSLNENFYPGPQPEPTPIKIGKNSSYYYSKLPKNYNNLNNEIINDDNNFGNSLNSFYKKAFINYNASKNNQDNNKVDEDNKKLNFILNNLQLQNLAIIFKQNYISFDDLFLLTKEDLLEMKIAIGQRNRIIHFITEYRKIAKHYDLNELTAFFNMYKKKLLSKTPPKNNQIENFDEKSNNTENYSVSLLSLVQNQSNNINKSSITNSEISSINNNSSTVNNKNNGLASLKMNINQKNLDNDVCHYKKIINYNKSNSNQRYNNKNIKIENNQYYYNINNNNYCNNNRTFNKKNSFTRNKIKNNNNINNNKKYRKNSLTTPIEDSHTTKNICFNKTFNKNGNAIDTKLKSQKKGHPVRLVNKYTRNFNDSSIVNKNITVNGRKQNKNYNNSLIKNEFLTNNSSKSENKILKIGNCYKNSKLYENFKNLSSEVENFQIRYQKTKNITQYRENKINYLLIGKQNEEKNNTMLLFKENINCDQLYKIKDLKNEYIRDLNYELNK